LNKEDDIMNNFSALGNLCNHRWAFDCCENTGSHLPQLSQNNAIPIECRRYSDPSKPDQCYCRLVAGEGSGRR
jgi:hypothetical protein